jgi:hypothetical protein
VTLGYPPHRRENLIDAIFCVHDPERYAAY